ncbi:MAG TPA: nucleotide disphospho-sugar-binding domain-containing protein [Solirubrobacterales bacterium]|nr:nucleotide disphospho-sugar-binding domain-containing protein [Solirubrobacterales bacterium]
MAILEELRRRGHDVALRTLADEVAKLRSMGFEAKPIAPGIEALRMDDWKAKTPVGRARGAMGVFGARAEHDAPDLRRAIEEERPDAVLVDIVSWGALAAAEAWGGPWASFSPLPLLLPSPDAPPFGPGLHPARGPLGRLRDRLMWASYRAGLDPPVLSRLNPLRATLDLDPLGHAYDLFLKPPLLLYMTANGFEYPRSDWPESIVMVGPCAWDPPAELPLELAGIEVPFVLVTTSSEFQDDNRLARVALTALADEPYHVVATLPSASTEGLSVPPNATVLPFAPHGPILDRSACAITHGGMGATQKALARGIPVCVAPFGRDQFEVARRVEVASAGSRLPPWRLRPNRLREKVREAIACRAGAERVAAAFAATGGPPAAADAFERRLGLRPDGAHAGDV